jgi:hypothetical protein
MTASTHPTIRLTGGSSLTTTSLVAAAPLEALLASLNEDLTFLKDRFPASSELVNLQRFRNDLVRALDEARRADVWLAPKEIAEQTGKGLSTVTKECRELQKLVGAVRNGKRGWRIHWPTYQSWMVGQQQQEKAA